ncbi:LacI family DNA-binding transcriptional regulator [Mycolicibacterium agri]|uniref:LacI family DNA-binding transcriptional regulator n=1 Tax=Mycolicibacterium agri TaxID=36811 RepID=UPI0013D21325|nr:LacI family DNA-binding transcriptional regulator [Mycolicibacterium agri]
MSADTSRITRVGVREVAERAGVSIATVSRVLSNHPNVSRATHERVTAAVRELGYQPNALGQMLRRGATRIVGFSIGDISNPLFAQIALGAEATLAQHGYSLVLSNSHGEQERELTNLAMLENRRVDGLLLSVTTETDSQLLQQLARFDGPLVAIDRDIATPTASVSCVQSDHAVGMTAALEALHAQGHRRVALLAGLATLRPGRERISAANVTAKALGMKCEVLSGEFAGPDAGAIVKLLRRPKRPTALVAGNNQLIAAALDALREAGLSYPRDLSLVVCDDVPLLRFFQPTLATIRRDPYQMGTNAAQLVLERLVGPAAEARTVVLPTTFVPGDSVGPAPK